MPIGLAAGYLGGRVDALISRFTDAVLACPFLILVITLVASLGPSLTNAMIATRISATPVFVRLTRGPVLAVKVDDYMRPREPWATRTCASLCATSCPTSWRRSSSRLLAIAAAIIAEASLSFLGLGQQPPAPSWGSMLNAARNYVDQAPWMAIWPGVSIFLLVLAFNFACDGVRDAH